VAIVGVLHLNKKTDVQAIYRVSGSIAFTATARVIWYVAEDGENEGRRLLSILKNNISARPKRELGMAYRIEDGNVVFEPMPMRKTPQEILSDQAKMERRGVRKEAVEFLKDVLSKGPLPSSEIQEKAEDKKFSFRTLRYAKDELGIRAYREGEKWFWELPLLEEEEEDTGEEDK